MRPIMRQALFFSRCDVEMMILVRPVGISISFEDPSIDPSKGSPQLASICLTPEDTRLLATFLSDFSDVAKNDTDQSTPATSK